MFLGRMSIISATYGLVVDIVSMWNVVYRGGIAYGMRNTIYEAERARRVCSQYASENMVTWEQSRKVLIYCTDKHLVCLNSTSDVPLSFTLVPTVVGRRV